MQYCPNVVANVSQDWANIAPILHCSPHDKNKHFFFKRHNYEQISNRYCPKNIPTDVVHVTLDPVGLIHVPSDVF
jgi:hypothetical protein